MTTQPKIVHADGSGDGLCALGVFSARPMKQRKRGQNRVASATQTVTLPFSERGNKED